MARAVFRNTILAFGLALSLAAPATAQMFSDGYEFLKAVKDGDGQAVTDALSQPGSVIVNTRDRSTGESALHIVTKRRDALWIRFLTEKGANPNIHDKQGVTPLAIASSLGFVEGVEELLKAGAQVDEASDTGETPLIAAIHRRDVAMIRVLLANGANPERSDNSGRTAHDYAVLVGGRVQDEFEKAAEEHRTKNAAKSYGPKLQ